jgi:hypothetical protein
MIGGVLLGSGTPMNTLPTTPSPAGAPHTEDHQWVGNPEDPEWIQKELE